MGLGLRRREWRERFSLSFLLALEVDTRRGEVRREVQTGWLFVPGREEESEVSQGRGGRRGTRETAGGKERGYLAR